MYYNMRVRMAERKLAEMQLSLTTRQTTMQEIPEESLRTLNHSIKNVCEICQAFLKEVILLQCTALGCCHCEAC